MGTQQTAVKTGRALVMSIHPRFADQIMAGTKRVEFRKRRIADDVTHVFVYSTKPVGAVIGAFTVDGQITSSPQILWQRFHEVAGIGRDDFMDYYRGRQAGTGITVGAVVRATRPMCLRDDLGVDYPPQSFQYVASNAARTALDELISADRYLTGLQTAVR